MKTYVVTPHLKRLDETFLMMGHKICFYGENMANYPWYPFLSEALEKIQNCIYIGKHVVFCELCCVLLLVSCYKTKKDCLD